MTRPTTIVFCERDSRSALELAKTMRDGTRHVELFMASPHISYAETNDEVLIMPDVTRVCREAIRNAYPNAKDVTSAKDYVIPKLETADADNVVTLPVIPVKRPRGRPRKYPRDAESI